MMQPREILPGIDWVGVVDWNRRMFDALIPLPDGTTYNAYLVKGSEKTALIDGVDPAFLDTIESHLSGVEKIDYIIAQHAEQDHSGAIPRVMELFPEAKLLCSSKAVPLLADHLGIPEEKWIVVEDGEELSLGDKTLRFLYTPWVHWPETMCTYLAEDQILFTCDFFGSHYAGSSLFAGKNPVVLASAKRYFAEIMFPFRKIIQGHLRKIAPLSIRMIAPSHGPVYDTVDEILAAYDEWTSEKICNKVLIPYISMHGSTEKMVNYLVHRLAVRGIEVHPFELNTTDTGKLAMELVDATTLIVATPTVYAAPHPAVVSALYLANALRPKLRYTAIVGSYGWGTRVAEHVAGLTPQIKAELLGTVLVKGDPRPEAFEQLDLLVEAIAAKHAALSFG